jgi:hypothetical protein
LLTNADGGGLTHQDFYAVAGKAFEAAKHNSDGHTYKKYGCGPKYAGMQTALHEVAHAFLGDFEHETTDSDTSVEHDCGNVYQHSCGYNCSKWYRTPIGHGADADENACGNDIPHDHDDKCNAMYWDPDCATDKFSKTSKHQGA